MISSLEKAFENATAPCRSLALWPIRLTMAGIFLIHGAGKFMMPAMAAMMGLSVPVWYVVAKGITCRDPSSCRRL